MIPGDVAVVWLQNDRGALVRPADDGAAALDRDRDTARALDRWARSRGLRVVRPSEHVHPALPVTAAALDTIEQDLERARDGIASQNGEAADLAIEHAREQIYAHPELPNAAWMLAEVERVAAARFSRVNPIDRARAEDAASRADSLDGARIAGIGEVSPGPRPKDATLEVVVPKKHAVWVDGHSIEGSFLPLAKGPHHVRVTKGDETIWGGWITVQETRPTFRIPTPPCSRDDLETVLVERGRIQTDRVGCASWMLAIPANGSVHVALCHRGTCDPWTETRPLQPPPGLNPTEKKSHWPGWATWTLVGAGAVLATGVGLVASGVFEPAPHESRYTYGGLKTH